MRFTNVWATPLCSPTRVELLTGRYPFRTGWTVHHDSPRWGGQYFDWRREITFARMLKSAGYATAIAGKWQINDLRVQRDALQRHGFDEHCVWPGFETGNPISDSRYYDPYLQINGERRVHKGEFGPDVCSEFLIDFMRRHRDRPFLAYDSMLLVHGPNTTTPANRNAKEKGGALYPGMTAYLDDIVGREIRALDELGLRDNTIVIFLSDNGAPGTHCRANGIEIVGGKSKLTEAGIAMPMIVYAPGRVAPGTTSDDLVDFSDIFPTLAALCGASLPADVTIDGRSFADILAGKSPKQPRRSWIYSQLGPNRVIRDKQWKLWSDGKFFDAQADFLETKDLANDADPAAQAARKRLAAALDAFPADTVLPFPNTRPPAKGAETRPSPKPTANRPARPSPADERRTKPDAQSAVDARGPLPDLFVYRTLGENELRSYHENGYLTYGPALTERGLALMRDECMRAWNAEKGEFDPSKTWLQNALLPNIHRLSLTVRRYYCAGPMVDVAGQVVSPNVKGATSQLTFKMRGNTKPFGWHQDNGYGELDPYNAIGCLTALDDADVENGCLWILPGSHKGGQIDAGEGGTIAGKKAMRDITVQVDEAGAIPMPLKAGECLFFHALTLHKSEGNLSRDRDRRICSCVMPTPMRRSLQRAQAAPRPARPRQDALRRSRGVRERILPGRRPIMLTTLSLALTAMLAPACPRRHRKRRPRHIRNHHRRSRRSGVAGAGRARGRRVRGPRRERADRRGHRSFAGPLRVASAGVSESAIDPARRSQQQPRHLPVLREPLRLRGCGLSAATATCSERWFGRSLPRLHRLRRRDAEGRDRRRRSLVTILATLPANR